MALDAAHTILARGSMVLAVSHASSRHARTSSVGGTVAARALSEAAGDGIGVGELEHTRPGGKSVRQFRRVRQEYRLGQHVGRGAKRSHRGGRSFLSGAVGASQPRPVLAGHYAAWS